mmetsp:Transcript_6575/g.13765  ORF Transcript_6575/g.13765 Transcript_6575/m.13765 type:complete len:84 (-) Transcript_6575:4-255(-)
MLLNQFKEAHHNEKVCQDLLMQLETNLNFFNNPFFRGLLCDILTEGEGPWRRTEKNHRSGPSLHLTLMHSNDITRTDESGIHI